MKFFERHRWPTFEGIMMILIVVISVFSFAFFTADNKVSLFSSSGNSITGNMVKVTGMAGKLKAGDKIYSSTSNPLYLEVTGKDDLKYTLKSSQDGRTIQIPITIMDPSTTWYIESGSSRIQLSGYTPPTAIKPTTVPWSTSPVSGGTSEQLYTLDNIQSIPSGKVVPIDENNDGKPDYYAGRNPRDSNIRTSNSDGTWKTEPLNFNYQFQVTASRTTETVIVNAPTQAQAQQLLKATGATVSRGTLVTQPASTSGGTFQAQKVGNAWFATNGQEARFAEDQTKAENLAKALNGITQTKTSATSQGVTLTDAQAAQVYLINNNNIVTRTALNTLGYTQITSASQTGGTTVQAPIKMGDNAWIYKGQVINDDEVLAVFAMKQQYAREVAQKEGLTSTGFYSGVEGATEIFKTVEGKYQYININDGTVQDYPLHEMFKQEKVGQDGKQTLISKYDNTGKLLSTYFKGHDSREVTPDEVQLIKDFKGTITVSGNDIILKKTETDSRVGNTETKVTLTKAGTKTTEITVNNKKVSKEVTSKDGSKSKETFWEDVSTTKSLTTTSSSGNTLSLSYSKKDKFQSGTYKTKDDRKINIGSKEVAAYVKGLSANDPKKADDFLYLATRGTTLGAELNTNDWIAIHGTPTKDEITGWKLSNSDKGDVIKPAPPGYNGLTTTGAKITKGQMIRLTNSGSDGSDIIIASEGGSTYIYYAVDKKGTVQSSGFWAMREFDQKTEVGGMPMDKSYYIVEDEEGRRIFKGDQLIGWLGTTEGKDVAITNEQLWTTANNGLWGRLKTTEELRADGITLTQKQIDSLKDRNAYVSWARFNRAYEAAQGGRAWSTLFGMEDNAWRKAMDNFFATNVIGQAISGKWEDSICHFYIPKDSDSVLNFNMPGGIVGTGAHIEGERTQITYPNGSVEYLYKITYGIKNPITDASGHESDSINYNVYLYGSRTVKLFSGDREVEPGDEVRGMGSNEGAIPPRYSASSYTRVCIKFRDDITTASGKEASEVCSPISSYSGSPSSYGSSDSGGSSGGGEGGSGGINDY
ncbi:MAG: hypothetical protein KJ561_04485 [Nanoarchaeota archaeon]|nr:hypothetical protein [Nanoarchaeota archaeon]